MNHKTLPSRVRVLVLGGGIHGVGVLHDLASRGWHDVCLVEKATLASGTSSRSTKLVHGGLRYLQRIRDFGLVAEALHERAILREAAPDLVTPLELYLPIVKGGMPGWMVRTGLALYDVLAGKYKIHKHGVITDRNQVLQNTPMLDLDKTKKVLSFWDMQTDDAGLVRRVAASAEKCGGKIFENCEVLHLAASDDGWNVVVRDAQGKEHVISALYVFNALGPWSNRLLEQSKIKPKFGGVNSKGVHLLLPDMGHKAGLFLQSPEDKRIFFMLPWQGYTLLGTTEDRFDDHPDKLNIEEREVQYLLQHCNRYLRTPIKESDVKATFAGLRWLQVEDDRDLNTTTRSDAIGEHLSGRGLLLTLYGGKLTTYRHLAETIGDRITNHFGEFKASATEKPTMWIHPQDAETEKDVLTRFLKGGLAYSPRT